MNEANLSVGKVYNIRILTYILITILIRPTSIFHRSAQYHNIQPNRITYNSLLNGFAVQGDMAKAEEVLERMIKEAKVKPNKAIYY